MEPKTEAILKAVECGSRGILSGNDVVYRLGTDGSIEFNFQTYSAAISFRNAINTMRQAGGMIFTWNEVKPSD